ncbi:MAG TPA: GxxExxY protein [Planctomycetota bacterium]|nr:GxxExxY protein [Planctomycetota bacterium]
MAKAIVHAAYLVHRAIGPGLLESIYEACFCHELSKAGLAWKRQVAIPLIYDGVAFDEGLRVDVLVEDLVICELKAVEKVIPVHRAALLSQLRLSGRRLGFLINFHVPLIKGGIERLVMSSY